MATETINIIAGIDTHSDTHHVAIINEHGKPIADKEFLAVGSGYRKIVEFITGHGIVTAVGVEGTGSYGAEIARTLRGEGLTVLEVNRPNRAARRLKGKSDPLDAYQAAKAVLDGRATSVPKAKDGPVECLRILRTSRASAMKARTAAINQIKGLLVSAPDRLRNKYRGLTTGPLLVALQRSRPSGHIADPEFACLLTLKTLATRCQALAAEIAVADAALQEILDSYAPLLCDLPGVGTDVASQLLVTVGDNPDRLGNEAQFAALVGVAPIPRVLRQNDPPPAQQRRGPSREPCLASSSPSPHGVLSADQRLRGQTQHRRQKQTRHYALPQAIRGPGNLPADHQSPSGPRQLRPTADAHNTRLHNQ